MFNLHTRFYLIFIHCRYQTEGLLIAVHYILQTNYRTRVTYFWKIYYHALATRRGDVAITQFHASFRLTCMHSLPGATTHAGSWPTQEVAFNHLYLWPWPSSS